VIEIINKLLLLHLFGCLNYFISDSRARSYQKGEEVALVGTAMSTLAEEASSKQ
jgi:hypothetical protein